MVSPTRTTGLIIIVIILLASTNVLAAVLGNRKASHPPEVAEPTECTSRACKRAADRIGAWIDNSEKPCNNFFQFACGGWINDRVIPNEKSDISSPSGLRDDVLVKVKTVLESNIVTEDEKANKMIRKMRKYYNNCLDRNNFGSSRKLLGQLFSTVPLPYINETGWLNQGKVEFESFLADLELNDVHILVKSTVVIDYVNVGRHVFVVKEPPMKLLPRRYFLDDASMSIRREYKKLMERVLNKVYMELNITSATVNADAIIDLQIKIANITTPRHKLYSHSRSVKELVNSSHLFNWRKYFDQRMSILKSGRKLEDEDTIEVHGSKYLTYVERFEEILNDITKNTVGQLATFLLVDRFKTMLSEEYRSMFADFKEVFRGTRGDNTRWKQCAKSIKDTVFKEVLSRIYSQQYFDKTSKAEVLEMISYIREGFNKLLEANTWMDNSTRQMAVKKLKKMDARIGYPDYILNGTYLEKSYSEIPVNDGEFFMDQLKINRIINERKLQKLFEETDRNRWITRSIVVNAFYFQPYNQMYFPMGILSAPFFDKDFPKYLNYGGIGTTIGHEITHGFDRIGGTIDGNGNRKQWWTSSTMTNFKKVAQCIIDQYSRYKAPIKIRNITVNGDRTQRENLADDGAIKQSYLAYKEWVKKRGKSEPKLPDLPYTPEQLFFINYGQIWCEKMREKEWVRRLLTKRHTPKMYRVIGALSNTPYFQKVFECQPGDQMNPSDKCRVW